MNRKEIFNILLNLAGPLGPFQKMDSIEHFEKMHIGGLRHPDSVAILEPLFKNVQLNDDEIIRLACAFGEIGGLRALELLHRIKELYSDRSPEVLREIEIGIEYATRKRY